MTKKVIALLAAVLTAGYAYGQGQIIFDHKSMGTASQVSLDPIEGGTLLTGTAYQAQLYAAAGLGAAEASLVAVGKPVYFRTGINIGYAQTTGTGPDGAAVNSTVQLFTGGTQNGPATVQLRAWESSRGASWDAAGGANAIHVGESGLVNVATTGGYGDPPTVPPTLTGIQGFSLRPVPEPSTIALGLLGAAALLIRRRK